MKEKIRLEVENILESIYAGAFNERDIKVLLIDLREYLPEGEITKDIAHFIAHSNERSKGITVTYLEVFVFEMLRVFKMGGQLKVRQIFTQQEIIDNLYSSLKRNGFNVKKTEFYNQSKKMMESILGIIEDVEIKLKNPNVIRSYLTVTNNETGNKSVHFCVNVRDTQGVVSLKENVAICIEAFTVS